MVDLIPIGTTNRTSTENNPVSVSDAVEKPSPLNAATDENTAPRIDRRRASNRRRGKVDRRLLKKAGAQGKRSDRRQNPDRRMRKRNVTGRTFPSSKQGRLGGIIDETV